MKIGADITALVMLIRSAYLHDSMIGDLVNCSAHGSFTGENLDSIVFTDGYSEVLVTARGITYTENVDRRKPVKLLTSTSWKQLQSKLEDRLPYHRDRKGKK